MYIIGKTSSEKRKFLQRLKMETRTRCFNDYKLTADEVKKIKLINYLNGWTRERILAVQKEVEKLTLI